MVQSKLSSTSESKGVLLISWVGPNSNSVGLMKRSVSEMGLTRRGKKCFTQLCGDSKKAGSKTSFIPSLHWHNPFGCFVILNLEKQHTI